MFTLGMARLASLFLLSRINDCSKSFDASCTVSPKFLLDKDLDYFTFERTSLQIICQAILRQNIPARRTMLSPVDVYLDTSKHTNCRHCDIPPFSKIDISKYLSLSFNDITMQEGFPMNERIEEFATLISTLALSDLRQIYAILKEYVQDQEPDSEHSPAMMKKDE